MVITRDFWTGRPVLVTGHTGFKGGWLCWWLKRLGAKVSGLALDPPTTPNLYQASGLGAEMTSVRADVRDLDRLGAALSEYRPEIVFHMAAQPLVRQSYRQPVDTFTTNVVGTVNCLEAARRCEEVRAVVVVTTDKCYANRGSSKAHREGDELGGDDPYAASKACAELVVHAYRKSFFESGSKVALVASARAGNVIGGGDWGQDRLVPDAVRAFSSVRQLGVRNPQSTRPWQHVLEPLCGYLMLAERLHRGDRSVATAWNFGPEAVDVKSVSWVADRLANLWGRGAAWRHESVEQPSESGFLVLDSDKARTELGWRALLTLEEALEWAVEWYRAYAGGSSARTLTIKQIDQYHERAR